MSAVERLLSRLDRVRRTGPGRWTARCPTREDKHPSLAIRELDDGRVLLHDFGGEDVASILSAVGLELADLFPDRPTAFGSRLVRPFNASQTLELVSFEASIAVIVCLGVHRSQAVTEEDYNRLLVAARRLADAAEVCHASR